MVTGQYGATGVLVEVSVVSDSAVEPAPASVLTTMVVSLVLVLIARCSSAPRHIAPRPAQVCVLKLEGTALIVV